jgi:DNA primase
MPAQWIDFKLLRQHLRFIDLAQLYHFDLKIRGDRAMALCPLPMHRQREDGSKRTASLSINLSRNIFFCHGCKASGNALDFALYFEGMNPNDPQAVREVALKLVRELNLDPGSEASASSGEKEADSLSPVRQKHQERVRSTPAPERTKAKGEVASVAKIKEDCSKLPVVVNPILDFELKNLDASHPYLASRGFTRETIAHFALGYCSRGIMKDRLAIPLYNPAGQLVGYAGRLVDDSHVSDEQPKYRFPGERITKEARITFAKSELLYNAHRVIRSNDLIVVEGFASVWWLHQHGFVDVVALMGSRLSDTQTRLILERVEEEGRLWIFADEDAAGEDLARDALYRLSCHRWCRRVHGEPGTQPTDWSGEELAAVFNR